MVGGTVGGRVGGTVGGTVGTVGPREKNEGDLQMKQMAKLRRQMGDAAFVAWCRNIGLPFERTYFYMFGRLP